jgi:hypothetical protein
LFRTDKCIANIVLAVVAGLSIALGLIGGPVFWPPGEQGRANAAPSATDAIPSAPAPAPAPAQEPTVKSLSTEEQSKFLEQRLPGNVIGNLGSFASLLFAMEGTAIGSSSTDVLHRPLHTIYPDKDTYMPTYAEFFDMIARQTSTSFKYLPEVNVWLFDEPRMPQPYTLKKADGWKEENRGMYVSYIPEVAPVGMDVYMMGRYSDISDAQSKKIRDIAALIFSEHIDPKLTVSDMKPATVNGADAIYFEAEAPVADRLWRQWAFFKNGQAFVIVSTYSKENKDKIVPAVDAMVKSFQASDKAPGPEAPATSS